MKRIWAKTFYIKRWTGRVLTRSNAPRFRPLDLGPDGSGSIQRSWSVLEIWIHQPRGSGPVNVWAFWFLSSFLFFFLCSPLFLLFGPPARFNFLTKIPKNCYVFLVCLRLFFCDILHVEN